MGTTKTTTYYMQDPCESVATSIGRLFKIVNELSEKISNIEPAKEVKVEREEKKHPTVWDFSKMKKGTPLSVTYEGMDTIYGIFSHVDDFDHVHLMNGSAWSVHKTVIRVWWDYMWTFAPEGANYAAMDENGEWYFYDAEPRRNEYTCEVVSRWSITIGDISEFSFHPYHNWKQSLMERPE